MDDIYDNLENYNDLNVVDELKNENKELKSKLQEYSNAMNQLQTDLDKLNSEYKKLEMNYSSLLKTARAEIERKTQLITNLNKEKDMLVIRSMQKGRKNILNNFNRDMYYKKETERKDSDQDLANGNINKSGPKVLNVSEGLRCEAVLAPSKNSPSSVVTLGTANSSTSTENKNRNTSDKHCSDSKENISKSASVQMRKDDKTKSIKITNRRKSIPALSNADEINSAEEVDDHGAFKHSSSRNQHNENKNYYEQYGCKSYKPSEHSNYESRNNYYNKRYTDNYNPYQRDTHPLELQRNADYQTRSHFQMYSRHSSERDRYKPHRIYNHSQRLDYNQRVLESPPLDKYIRSKSRERRHQEKDYQRDYNVYNNKNKRNEHHSNERDYTKEPDYKRRRIESTGTDTEKNDRCIDRKSYKHSDHNSTLKHENYTSCQSPDYDQFEPTPTTQHFVKEIKYTATVQLEDPRMTSKKHLQKNTDDEHFITRAGKNVCMVPIDKLKWGIEKVEVPEALKEHPSSATLNDDLIKNIYMDIDIPSLHIEEYNKNQIIEDKSHMLISSDTPEVTKHKEDTSKLKNRDDLKTHIQTLKEHNQTPKILLHYKIPKKSSADSQDIIKSKKKVDEDTKKDERRLETACDVPSKDMDDVENSCSTKLKSQVQRLAPIKDNIEGDLELSDEASDVTDDNDKVKESISVHDIIHDIKYKETDSQKYKTAKENTKVDESRNNIYNQASNKDAMNIIEKFENNISAEICKEQITKKGDEFKNTLSKIETVEKDTEDSKSCNSRKYKEEKKVTVPKKHYECKTKITKKVFQEEATALNQCKVSKSQIKRKRISKGDTYKCLQESQVHSENLDSSAKTQPKDDETKNKFTELFGESSSLITPHDLGISTKFEINALRNDKYGSLFENTQDAIDFNVREIQENLNTEENTKDPLCSEPVASENVPLKTSSYIDKKPIFQIEDEHSASSIFKNLKPADSENESHIVKTVVISSGMQPYIEEKDMHKKDLPEIECNDDMEKVADKQLSLELLKAVATSTPHKMDLEFPLRLSEISRAPSNESMSKNDDDITVLNTSSTSTTAPESNAPDVRIFLKRRRKIKKT